MTQEIPHPKPTRKEDLAKSQETYAQRLEREHKEEVKRGIQLNTIKTFVSSLVAGQLDSYKKDHKTILSSFLQGNSLEEILEDETKEGILEGKTKEEKFFKDIFEIELQALWDKKIDPRGNTPKQEEPAIKAIAALKEKAISLSHQDVAKLAFDHVGLDMLPDEEKKEILFRIKNQEKIRNDAAAAIKPQGENPTGSNRLNTRRRPHVNLFPLRSRSTENSRDLEEATETKRIAENNGAILVLAYIRGGMLDENITPKDILLEAFGKDEYTFTRFVGNNLPEQIRFLTRAFEENVKKLWKKEPDISTPNDQKEIIRLCQQLKKYDYTDETVKREFDKYIGNFTSKKS